MSEERNSIRPSNIKDNKNLIGQWKNRKKKNIISDIDNLANNEEDIKII